MITILCVMGDTASWEICGEKLKEMGMEYVVVAKDEEQAESPATNGITAMSSR